MILCSCQYCYPYSRIYITHKIALKKQRKSLHVHKTITKHEVSPAKPTAASARTIRKKRGLPHRASCCSLHILAHSAYCRTSFKSRRRRQHSRPPSSHGRRHIRPVQARARLLCILTQRKTYSNESPSAPCFALTRIAAPSENFPSRSSFASGFSTYV